MLLGATAIAVPATALADKTISGGFDVGPGGFPCFDRTASHSPVDLTTSTRVPLPILDNTRDEPDGSS